MRIAEIAPPWYAVPPAGYGGIEQVVADLSDGLTELGHEVTLFASGGSQSRAQIVSPIPEPPGIGGALATAHETYHAVSAYASAEHFDVIHDHTWVGPALGAMRGHRGVVHTLHGPWSHEARRHFALLRERVHLVAISETQRSANPDVPYAGVVHNGINLRAYPLRRAKEDFLLFIGRSCYDKGPDRAVEVARLAGLPLKMVVKRQEPFERDYWESAVEPKLTGAEEVFDEVDPLLKVDLLQRAKALLFPISWPEPFGLVMVEAMACGTPVLAFRQGAATEVVEDGVTGALCDSLERMAEMVNWVDRIDPMACRRRVAEHFSSEAMVLGYDHIFRTLLADERRWGRREKQVRGVRWCDAPADEEERDAAGAPDRT